MKRLGRFLMAALKVTLGFFVWLSLCFVRRRPLSSVSWLRLRKASWAAC